MKSAKITVFALFTLAAATGCSMTTQSAVAQRECSAPGAYVVSPPTIHHGFDADLASPAVRTVGAAKLQGRGIPADTSHGVPVRTATDTSMARGGPNYCF